MKTSTLILLVILVLVTGCLGNGGSAPEESLSPPEDNATTDATANTTVEAPEPYTDAVVSFVVDGEERGVLAVEVAETPSERARGLMGRESLPDDTGMLFVYEEADDRSFWMLNTKVPLDMVFVDGDRRVVNVEHASPGFQGERYRSDGPARFVVEAERGYANETGISAGDELVISPYDG